MRVYAIGKFQASWLAALSGLLTGMAGMSYAANANNVGWVLADQPNASSYTPSAQHTFNSAHGATLISAIGGEAYAVTFKNLYSGSAPYTILISGGNTPNRCISYGAVPSGQDVVVTVRCYTPSGGYVRAPFTLLYQSRTDSFGNAKEGIAFTTYAQGQTISSNDSFNSSGGNITFFEGSEGNYGVSIPGLTNVDGTVQITPEYVDSGNYEARCKPVYWRTNTAGTYINVNCFGANNRFANVNFHVAYAVGESLGVVGGVQARGTWGLANQISNMNAYPMAFQFNGFKTGSLTAQKTGTGQYQVTIPGTLSYSTSNALVTAYGRDSNYCNIGGWTTNTINVACFNQSGAPSDTAFDVSFQTAD